MNCHSDSKHRKRHYELMALREKINNMIKAKCHILQKDIPGQPKGTRYVLFEKECEYRPVSEHGLGPFFAQYTVENNPEWFVPEQTSELQRAIHICVSAGYKVSDLYDAPPDPAKKYTEVDMRESFVAGVRWAQDDTVVERRYWCQNAFDACLKSINK